MYLAMFVRTFPGFFILHIHLQSSTPPSPWPTQNPKLLTNPNTRIRHDNLPEPRHALKNYSAPFPSAMALRFVVARPRCIFTMARMEFPWAATKTVLGSVESVPPGYKDATVHLHRTPVESRIFPCFKAGAMVSSQYGMTSRKERMGSRLVHLSCHPSSRAGSSKTFISRVLDRIVDMWASWNYTRVYLS